MKRCLGSFVFAMAVAVLAAAAPPVDSPIPSDSEIRKILTERIDAQRRGVGIVVGVIEPAGRRVVSYGRFQAGDPRPLNGDTVFEIGSVTKVFTALLLADMVQRGEAAMDDPVSKYLPPEIKVPERDGRLITLQDLATHSSGLPRLPTNLTPKDPANPYADYSVEQLYEFLPTYELTRDIGSKYEYSNLGGGLLGHVLARGAGMDYEALVRSRICELLGMDSTRIRLSPEMKTRLASGHNAELAPVPQLGSADSSWRGRAAVECQRHASFPRGQPRLPEITTGSSHGSHVDGTPPDRSSGAGDRSRLARADTRRC